MVNKLLITSVFEFPQLSLSLFTEWINTKFRIGVKLYSPSTKTSQTFSPTVLPRQCKSKLFVFSFRDDDPPAVLSSGGCAWLLFFFFASGVPLFYMKCHCLCTERCVLLCYQVLSVSPIFEKVGAISCPPTPPTKKLKKIIKHSGFGIKAPVRLVGSPFQGR